MARTLIAILFTGVIFFSCDLKTDSGKNVDHSILDSLSREYVKLALEIGQKDPDFVDAYYGPDSLKPASSLDTSLPIKNFNARVDSLLSGIRNFKNSITINDSVYPRVNYLEHQLVAFKRRIKIVAGEKSTFETESSELFSVTVPKYTEQDFNKILDELEKTIPGEGILAERVDKLNKNFIIPKNKVDTVFKLSIAEGRRRTLQHFDLPKEESFKLEYVTNKPWGGYNWYKGNYQSLIQINTDLPIMIDRAIDIGCHEGYPGHHVYNMLLEKKLYRDKGWLEISLYPLFSPQSFIAEGSANYGIEMVFPGEEKIKFLKDVLLPAAGMDTTNISAYMKSLEIRLKLNYVRNEVARALINNTMNEEEAIKWLQKYSFATPESAAKTLSFIRKYGSYVICYNYGQDLVKNYVSSATNTTDRWKQFEKLLSNPITPDELEILLKEK